MIVPERDALFALDCWTNRDAAGLTNATDYHDRVDGLREIAIGLLRAGRFKAIDIARRESPSEEWECIESLTADDIDKDP